MFLATLPRTVCSSHCLALTPYLGPPLFLCPPYSAWALTPWAEVLPCRILSSPCSGPPVIVCCHGSREAYLASHPLWVLLLFFSGSVVSNPLQPHGQQDTRLPCSSLSPRVFSNSCSLSQWCIQPSHPLSLLSPPVLNLSQHPVPFPWVGSSHQAAEVLQLQLQHQSFQWIFRVDFL